MRFAQHGELWLLIDEAAAPEANVIATLRSPVELLALKGLCEARLGAGDPMQPFDVTAAGHRYRVTPYSDRGGRITLRIDRTDGSLSRVETEFTIAKQ